MSGGTTERMTKNVKGKVRNGDIYGRLWKTSADFWESRRLCAELCTLSEKT